MTVLYSNYDQVRAALGLTDRELTDKTIADLDVSTLVELELDTVYPLHVPIAVAVENATATSAERRIFNLLKLFCAYQAAVFLLPQFQMLTAQMLSDGDAQMRRFTPDDIEETKSQIRGMLATIKEKLNPEQYAISPLIPFIAVSPTYNPVTNEGDS